MVKIFKRDIADFGHSHVEDTGWLPLPPLQNGWGQYPGWEIAAYRRLNGLVFYKGLLIPGTTTPGTLLFTMPAGFRNIGPSHTPVASGAASGGAVNIFNDGRVQANYNISGWLSLNGICYPADN